MGFSWPGSAPCAPNSVASFVQPVRASLHFRPAEAPKVAHIPITAPAAALCVLARTQAGAGCLAFLRRSWLTQKNSCARSARPASRGCSNLGPGIGGGRWVSDVAVGIARDRGMRCRIKRPSTQPVPAICHFYLLQRGRSWEAVLRRLSGPSGPQAKVSPNGLDEPGHACSAPKGDEQRQRGAQHRLPGPDARIKKETLRQMKLSRGLRRKRCVK